MTDFKIFIFKSSPSDADLLETPGNSARQTPAGGAVTAAAANEPEGKVKVFVG
jgi:hypothetical protein